MERRFRFCISFILAIVLVLVGCAVPEPPVVPEDQGGSPGGGDVAPAVKDTGSLDVSMLPLYGVYTYKVTIGDAVYESSEPHVLVENLKAGTYAEIFVDGCDINGNRIWSYLLGDVLIEKGKTTSANIEWGKDQTHLQLSWDAFDNALYYTVSIYGGKEWLGNDTSFELYGVPDSVPVCIKAHDNDGNVIGVGVGRTEKTEGKEQSLKLALTPGDSEVHLVTIDFDTDVRGYYYVMDGAEFVFPEYEKENCIIVYYRVNESESIYPPDDRIETVNSDISISYYWMASHYKITAIHHIAEPIDREPVEETEIFKQSVHDYSFHLPEPERNGWEVVFYQIEGGERYTFYRNDGIHVSSDTVIHFYWRECGKQLVTLKQFQNGEDKLLLWPKDADYILPEGNWDHHIFKYIQWYNQELQPGDRHRIDMDRVFTYVWVEGVELQMEKLPGEITTETYEIGQKIKLESSSRAGYTLEGISDGTTMYQPGDIYELNVDTKLEYIWKAVENLEYTVTLKNRTNGDSLDTVTVPAGPYRLPDGTWKGHKITRVSVDGVDHKPGEVIEVSGDITVEYFWAEIVKVTLTGIPTGSSTRQYGKGEVFTIPSYEKPGHYIEKVTSGTEVYSVGDEIELTGDITLEYHWAKVVVDMSCTITLKGLPGDEVIEWTKGSPFEIPEKTREGFRLNNITCNGKVYTPGRRITPDTNITIWYNWIEQVTLTICDLPGSERVVVKDRNSSFMIPPVERVGYLVDHVMVDGDDSFRKHVGDSITIAKNMRIDYVWKMSPDYCIITLTGLEGPDEEILWKKGEVFQIPERSRKDHLPGSVVSTAIWGGDEYYSQLQEVQVDDNKTFSYRWREPITIILKNVPVEGGIVEVPLHVGDDYVIPSYEREGYRLLHVYYNEVRYQPGQTAYIHNDLIDPTFTYVWEKIPTECTITLRGLPGPDQTITWKIGEDYTLPEQTWEKHRLEGIACESKTYKPGAVVPVSTDTVFEYKWVELVTVTLADIPGGGPEEVIVLDKGSEYVFPDKSNKQYRVEHLTDGTNKYYAGYPNSYVINQDIRVEYVYSLQEYTITITNLLHYADDEYHYHHYGDEFEIPEMFDSSKDWMISHYTGSDGREYHVGDVVTVTDWLTLKCVWEPRYFVRLTGLEGGGTEEYALPAGGRFIIPEKIMEGMLIQSITDQDNKRYEVGDEIIITDSAFILAYSWGKPVELRLHDERGQFDTLRVAEGTCLDLRNIKKEGKLLLGARDVTDPDMEYPINHESYYPYDEHNLGYIDLMFEWGDVANITIDDGSSVRIEEFPVGDAFDIPMVRKDGYVLEHVRCSDGNSYYRGDRVPVAGDMTFTYKWVPATSARNFEVDTWSSSYAIIEKYNGSSTGDVIIPEYIGDKPVLKIKEHAFEGCSARRIFVPHSVTTIGDQAFRDCRNLEVLYLPRNLKNVGLGITYGCTSLNSITMPDGGENYRCEYNCLIEKRNRWILAGCKNSTIPSASDVTGIRMQAFRDCSGLTSICIPKNIKSIDTSAFAGCDGLKIIEAVPGHDYFKSGGNCLYQSISSNGYLILGCSDSRIPANIVTIEKYAFEDLDTLLEIDIPASVNEIEPGAFSSCSNVGTVTVSPDNMTYYSDGNCIMKKDTNAVVFGSKGSVIPQNAKVIGSMAFDGQDAIHSLDIPDGLSRIEAYGFFDCTGMDTIFIPASVEFIGNNAFFGWTADQTIMFEAPSAPDTWDAAWNDGCKANVLWGQARP